MKAICVVPALDELEYGRPRLEMGSEGGSVDEHALEGSEEGLTEGAIVTGRRARRHAFR